MAAAVNPNSDPFRGGSFTPGANPLAVGGSIAPASTGSSLIGSVAGATPMLARNDRGSNVTIPYARVCFHPAGRTALGPIEGDAPNTANHLNATLGKPNGDLVVETELLYSGRIAFILGRRGKDYDAGVASTVGFDAMNTFGATPGNLVHSRQAGFLAQFAVGGSDMNTAQRLCSFEYLQRYFHHVLRTKVIEIGDRKIFANKAALVQKGHRSFQLLADATLDATKLTSVKTATLLDDVNLKYKGTEDAKTRDELTAAAPDSGLFLYDNGPFLRGKCLDHRLFKLRDGSSKKKTSLALGDNFAFEELQRLIAATGACDWTPDGVVLSKLSQGDKLLDDELDSRDGQLYNVTVSGPAVSSSWTGDYHREVMPLDKVFVVIVADVWDGVEKNGGEYKDASNFNIQGADYAAYKAAKRTLATTKALPNGRTPDEIEALVQADGSKAAITNMRVRLVTSSEMVNCSAMKPGKDNKTTVDPTSRMGLMISGDEGVSEYIIGGWCIGTVIDSAASRALSDGMSMLGGVKRAKSSFSCNVSVSVKWWSADKMYRAYMNRDGKNRARYDGPKGLPEMMSRKAGQRL